MNPSLNRAGRAWKRVFSSITNERTFDIYLYDLFALLHARADSLLDELVTAADILRKTAEIFGLAINFKVGNTEEIVALRGPGSKEAYRQLLPLEDKDTTDGACFIANVKCIVSARGSSV